MVLKIPKRPNLRKPKTKQNKTKRAQCSNLKTDTKIFKDSTETKLWVNNNNNNKKKRHPFSKGQQKTKDTSILCTSLNPRLTKTKKKSPIILETLEDKALDFRV
jgi:hypothetical protein